MGLATGQKPQDMATGIIVDQIAKTVAQKIGEGRLSYVPHKVAHLALGAGLGAASAEATGGDVEKAAFAAGLGALVSEVVADALKDPDKLGEKAVAKAQAEGLPMTEETLIPLIKEEARGLIDVSRLSAGVAALLSGQDVDLAVKAATNAVENNCAGALLREALKSPPVRAALAEAAVKGAAFLKKAGDAVNKVVKAAKAIDKATSSQDGGGPGDFEPDDEKKKRDKVFPDNPKEAKSDFNQIKGTKAQQNKKDGSIWEKDTSSHGGEQWKRWDNRKSWERGDKPTSVWPDGRIRK